MKFELTLNRLVRSLEKLVKFEKIEMADNSFDQFRDEEFDRFFQVVTEETAIKKTNWLNLSTYLPFKKTEKAYLYRLIKDGDNLLTAAVFKLDRGLMILAENQNEYGASTFRYIYKSSTEIVVHSIDRDFAHDAVHELCAQMRGE